MVIQLFNNTALIRLLYTAVLLYIIYLPVVHARLGGWWMGQVRITGLRSNQDQIWLVKIRYV